MTDNPEIHNFATGKSSLKLKITLAADRDAVDPVVQTVMELVRQIHCESEKHDAIELALTEALANAVVHGAKGDPSKIVECDVVSNEDQSILIVVRDPGKGFDPGEIPNPLRGRERLFRSRTWNFSDQPIDGRGKVSQERHGNPHDQTLVPTRSQAPSLPGYSFTAIPSVFIFRYK